MSYLRLLSVLLIFIAVSGCSTVGDIEDIVVSPTELQIVNKHDFNVFVDVIGGDNRFVSSELLKQSLIQTLNDSGVLKVSEDINLATHKLSVIVLKSETYKIGYDYTMSSKWILSEKNGNILWSDLVSGNGHSNAFGGVARQSASAERANKDTIANGVMKLGQLSL